MLIDNKFIYISLPRRGSTSFHYSCILSNFSIKTLDNNSSDSNSKIDFDSVNESDIMNYITHGHEPLTELYKKFGTKYPVIAVKRNRYETFYSLYKHILFDLKRTGYDSVFNHFKNIDIDELFFYKSEDLLNEQIRWDTINEYLLKNNLISRRYDIPTNLNIYSEEYVINVINILITPASYWHNNDSNIIWFDIDNLNEMAKWVSNITQKPFELKKVNSSKHMDTNLVLNDVFMKKYDKIYNYYDLPKSIKTLI